MSSHIKTLLRFSFHELSVPTSCLFLLSAPGLCSAFHVSFTRCSPSLLEVAGLVLSTCLTFYSAYVYVTAQLVCFSAVRRHRVRRTHAFYPSVCGPAPAATPQGSVKLSHWAPEKRRVASSRGPGGTNTLTGPPSRPITRRVPFPPALVCFRSLSHGQFRPGLLSAQSTHGRGPLYYRPAGRAEPATQAPHRPQVPVLT